MILISSNEGNPSEYKPGTSEQSHCMSPKYCREHSRAYILHMSMSIDSDGVHQRAEIHNTAGENSSRLAHSSVVCFKMVSLRVQGPIQICVPYGR